MCDKAQKKKEKEKMKRNSDLQDFFIGCFHLNAESSLVL